ncbi:hypothetical protein Aduo_005650 [Ancylostoma duodenale]
MSLEQLKRGWRNKKSHVRDLLHKEKGCSFIAIIMTGRSKCLFFKLLTRYWGGVDLEVEKAISKGLNEITEMDIKIATLLGKEASYLGLTTAESNVVTVRSC